MHDIAQIHNTLCIARFGSDVVIYTEFPRQRDVWIVPLCFIFLDVVFPSVVDFAHKVICRTCIIPILSLHLAVSQNLVQEKNYVVDTPHFALLIYVGLFAKRCQ